MTIPLPETREEEASVEEHGGLMPEAPSVSHLSFRLECSLSGLS